MAGLYYVICSILISVQSVHMSTLESKLRLGSGLVYKHC